MHLEFPIGAFVAAVLVLVPFPWHWRARNVPTLSIIAWLFISNITYGINAIIWADNVDIVVPVWCDITTKLQIGATIALPACCLCLCIHLERISSTRQVSSTYRDKKRRMIFDGLLCWVVPMIYMALHYIVQGHRFDIVETLGCRPDTFNSIQSIFIIWVPPLLAVALTLVYASLSLHHFMQRRLTFGRHLQDSSSALTTTVYFRLMAMAVVQMFWVVLIVVVNMWFTYRNGLEDWINWQNVHFNFSRIGLFPVLLIPPSVLRWTYFTWWSIPASSVIFFIFFAFGQDALKEYAACLHWIQRVIFRCISSKSKAFSSPSARVDLSMKTSSASSFATKVDPDTKPLSDSSSFSPQSKLVADSLSSIYSPTPYSPSTSCSETFTSVEHISLDHALHPPRYDNV